MMLAKCVGFLQAGVAAGTLCAEQLLHVLGVPASPAFLASLRDKRFGIIAGAWFLGNMVSNSLTSTGAFEVYYDGRLVYSKLQNGQLPTMEEMLGGIQQLMPASST